MRPRSSRCCWASPRLAPKSAPSKRRRNWSTIPQAFAKFQAAQGELSSALSRLLVVTENYPQLKSDQNFRDLQAQLEGTENRITVARNRYIQAVQNYNVTVRSFPSNLTAMMFGYKPKPNFTVENEAAISKPPTVDFSAPAARAGARASAGSGAGALVTRAASIASSRSRQSRARPRRAAARGADVAVPPLTARVIDLTGTLSGGAVNRIETEARGFRGRRRAARSPC